MKAVIFRMDSQGYKCNVAGDMSGGYYQSADIDAFYEEIKKLAHAEKHVEIIKMIENNFNGGGAI